MMPREGAEGPPPAKRFKESKFVEGAVTGSLKNLKSKMEACSSLTNDRAKLYLEALLQLLFRVGEGEEEQDLDTKLTCAKPDSVQELWSSISTSVFL